MPVNLVFALEYGLASCRGRRSALILPAALFVSFPAALLSGVRACAGAQPSPE